MLCVLGLVAHSFMEVHRGNDSFKDSHFPTGSRQQLQLVTKVQNVDF